MNRLLPLLALPILFTVSCKNRPLAKQPEPAPAAKTASLYEAAESGKLPEVHKLVAEGADLKQSGNEEGATPLHAASEKKHADVVRFLLQKGADANAPNLKQQTPLWRLSLQRWHKDTQIADILLEAGAKIDAPDSVGVTPLLNAVKSSNVVMAKWLIEKGADVNWATPNGATPLFLAAHTGQLEIAQLLLKSGAKPRGDPRLPSPLEVAKKKDYPQLVALLSDKKHSAKQAPRL